MIMTAEALVRRLSGDPERLRNALPRPTLGEGSVDRLALHLVREPAQRHDRREGVGAVLRFRSVEGDHASTLIDASQAVN